MLKKVVLRFFSKNQVGRSPDFALIKHSRVVSHLGTFYGYDDDGLVCNDIAKVYNDDISLSVMPGKHECIQLNSPASSKAASQKDVRRYFYRNRIGSSPDFAFAKYGPSGLTGLTIIHGFPDNRRSCESAIKGGYTANLLKRTSGKYKCLQLNK